MHCGDSLSSVHPRPDVSFARLQARVVVQTEMVLVWLLEEEEFPDFRDPAAFQGLTLRVKERTTALFHPHSLQ